MPFSTHFQRIKSSFRNPCCLLLYSSLLNSCFLLSSLERSISSDCVLSLPTEEKTETQRCWAPEMAWDDVAVAKLWLEFSIQCTLIRHLRMLAILLLKIRCRTVDVLNHGAYPEWWPCRISFCATPWSLVVRTKSFSLSSKTIQTAFACHVRKVDHAPCTVGHIEKVWNDTKGNDAFRDTPSNM